MKKAEAELMINTLQLMMVLEAATDDGTGSSLNMQGS